MFDKKQKLHKEWFKKMDAVVTGILLGWVIAAIYGIKKAKKKTGEENQPVQEGSKNRIKNILKLLIFWYNNSVAERKPWFFQRIFKK